MLFGQQGRKEGQRRLQRAFLRKRHHLGQVDKVRPTRLAEPSRISSTTCSVKACTPGAKARYPGWQISQASRHGVPWAPQAPSIALSHALPPFLSAFSFLNHSHPPFHSSLFLPLFRPFPDPLFCTLREEICSSFTTSIHTYLFLASLFPSILASFISSIYREATFVSSDIMLFRIHPP